MSIGVLEALMETDVGGECHTGNVVPQRAEQNCSENGVGFLKVLNRADCPVLVMAGIEPGPQ